jgi:threonylcarbamoyladenosine tRNA methylthiotransferase MtaB
MDRGGGLSNVPYFAVTTLGCKVNRSESEALALRLKALGWSPAGPGTGIDLLIVNTCAVTGKASMQSRQAIRRAARLHPGARIIATGCAAQIDPEAIGRIEGVRHIVGQAGKHTLPEDLAAWEKMPDSPFLSGRDISGECAFDPVPPAVSGGLTRPFLKIQDGCDAFCTYCIVPHARGRSRSLPPETALANLRELAAAGYREAVLTGIHLGAYGLDLTPKSSLLDLMERIDAEKSIERVRLSSIEPRELSREIIRRVGHSDIFSPHFHVPLQSGDNRILERMGRPYSRELFRELVETIHAQIPDAAIGTDVIAGFPGETREAFENSLSLIRELPITYLHVFPYSPRNGTPASRFPGRISPEIVRERCFRMRALGKEKKRDFYARMIGKEESVLIEETRDRASGLLKGLTGNYIPVSIEGDDPLKNRMLRVKITEAQADRLLGKWIP